MTLFQKIELLYYSVYEYNFRLKHPLLQGNLHKGEISLHQYLKNSFQNMKNFESKNLDFMRYARDAHRQQKDEHNIKRR